MIPLDVAVALGVALAILLALFVGIALGVVIGRRQTFAAMDPDHLAAAEYRVACPHGGPWLLAHPTTQQIYRENAARVLDDLAGEPR